MKKFKQLNQYEYLGLINLLKDIFPFLDNQTCGTCNDNLINIQNTYTDFHPNDKFSLLGSFGLTEGHDIVLEYWNTEEENSRLYYITYTDARDFEPSDFEPYICKYSKEHFNSFLKNL